METQMFKLELTHIDNKCNTTLYAAELDEDAILPDITAKFYHGVLGLGYIPNILHVVELFENNGWISEEQWKTLKKYTK